MGYKPRTSGLAVAALVLALVGGCGIGSVLGIVFGLMGLAAIRRDPYLGGRGLAIAGLVIGIVGLVLLVGVFILAFGIGQIGNGTRSSSVPVVALTTVEPPTARPPEGGAPTVLTPATATPATIKGVTPCPDPGGSSVRVIMFDRAPTLCIDPAKAYTATIQTNRGYVTIALDAAVAPTTVNNFVVLARYHYFDHTICHRIVEDFVIQCGDPTGTGSGANPGYTIPDELPASAYNIGDVAMANVGSPNTGGSQFFIISGPDGAALPRQYARLGTVTGGLDTTIPALNALHGPPAQAGDAGGVPTAALVVINAVTITES